MAPARSRLVSRSEVKTQRTIAGATSRNPRSCSRSSPGCAGRDCRGRDDRVADAILRNRNVFADTIAVKRLNPVVFWLAVFGAVWVATWLLTKVQRAVLAAGFHFSARGRWRVVVGLGPLLEF